MAPVAFDWEESFRAIQAPMSMMRLLQQDVQLTPSDLDVDYFEGDDLDLAALVEEQALLMIPQTIHCREECRGLCAACGADLNEGPCGCKAEPAAHPFAAMKDFLPGRRG